MRNLTLLVCLCIGVTNLTGCGGNTSVGKIRDKTEADTIFKERIAAVANFVSTIKAKDSERLSEAITRVKQSSVNFKKLDFNSKDIMLLYTQYENDFRVGTQEKESRYEEAKKSGLLTPEMIAEIADIKKF
jgi:hypothetical protein